VYISGETRKAAESSLGKIHQIKEFQCGTPFQIQNLSIRPFGLSHDAEDPAGFTIQQNGKKIGIATDLGIATSLVKEHLKSCTLLILEANHDPLMLENGPYPWPLKQRIKSRKGHLSNEATQHLLSEITHEDLKYVILAHLSEKNNTPEKAIRQVGQAVNGYTVQLSVATQDNGGNLLHIK
jgi:phosphoribosyl 1,2-cyclic phosphodiesterase